VSKVLVISKCVTVGVTMLSASLAAAASEIELKMCSLCFAAIFLAASEFVSKIPVN
jgi:hypothetical protein